MRYLSADRALVKIQVLWDIMTCPMAVVPLDTKDRDTTLLRNVGITLPFNTVQRHGRHESLVGRNPIFLNISVTMLDHVSADVLYLCKVPSVPACVKNVE
jgi:hypothetical protein